MLSVEHGWLVVAAIAIHDPGVESIMGHTHMVILTAMYLDRRLRDSMIHTLTFRAIFQSIVFTRMMLRSQVGKLVKHVRIDDKTRRMGTMMDPPMLNNRLAPVPRPWSRASGFCSL